MDLFIDSHPGFPHLTPVICSLLGVASTPPFFYILLIPPTPEVQIVVLWYIRTSFSSLLRSCSLHCVIPPPAFARPPPPYSYFYPTKSSSSTTSNHQQITNITTLRDPFTSTAHSSSCLPPLLLLRRRTNRAFGKEDSITFPYPANRWNRTVPMVITLSTWATPSTTASTRSSGNLAMAGTRLCGWPTTCGNCPSCVFFFFDITYYPANALPAFTDM